MQYAHRRTRDSLPLVVPLLLASAALGLLALAWRRFAPRADARLLGDGRNRLALAARTGGRAAASSDGAERGDSAQRDDTPIVFHRQYDVILSETGLHAYALMQMIQRQITEFAPATREQFESMDGRDGMMQVGDEYELRMLGPWNGMVRVCDLSPLAFTLMTVDGNPKAGQITFNVTPHDHGADVLSVNIDSWSGAPASDGDDAARSAPFSKQEETETWIGFLQRLSMDARAVGTPEVRITMEQLPIDEATEDMTRQISDG